MRMRLASVSQGLTLPALLAAAGVAAAQTSSSAAVVPRADAPLVAPEAPPPGTPDTEAENPSATGVMGQQKAAAFLTERLQTADSFKVRAQAAILLGRVGDPRGVPTLVRALESDDHFVVRASAATALGALADDRAAEPLFAGAADPEPLVRDACARAIMRLDARRNLEILLRYARDGGVDQRRAAVARLGDLVRTGDEGAVDAVLGALGDEREVRDAAATAVADLPDDRAVPLLATALSHDNAVIRAEAARLLGPRQDPRAVTALMAAYDRVAESERVKGEIRRSLERMSGIIRQPEVVSRARNAGDKSERVRNIRLLGVVGDPRAAGVLEELLQDPDDFIAGSAALALADMGSVQSIPRLEDATRALAGTRAQAPVDLALRRLRRQQASR
jgi:HEAT repeat protein